MKREDSLSVDDIFRDMLAMVGGEETIPVKRSVLSNGKVVSTVKLPPGMAQVHEALFETMVFPNEEDFVDIDAKWDTTEAEALATHTRLSLKWDKG